MAEHISYKETLKRDADFVVEYELDPDDALKTATPCQGMRVDFLYAGDDPNTDGSYMIWPELVDQQGLVVRDTTPGKMESKGRANMWVVDDKMRTYHAKRIKIGTKGFWVRGPFRIARVTVVAIGSLAR